MSYESKTEEIDPREIVSAYLERESQQWIAARDIARRSGHMNAEHNLVEAKHMKQIDALLEELGRLGGAAVGQVVSFPERPDPNPPEIVA